MNDLPLNALRAFAVVFSTSGVRAAARELGIAHSSVSRHLVQLERWIGAPLIEPAASGGGGRAALRFTRQGEELGKTVFAALREIARAAEVVRETRSPKSVVLTAAPSFAARWLLPRLPSFEAEHPELELSILVDQKLTDLESGGVDLAIRMGRGPWPDVQCSAWMDDDLYPVMSPDYWKRSRKPRAPAELVRLRLLHDRDPNAAWAAWRREHGPEELDVRRGPRIASTDLLLRAAAQGQGVALARGRLAEEELASGALIRPIGQLAVKLPAAYWIVLPEHVHVRPAVQAVIDWLEGEASGLR